MLSWLQPRVPSSPTREAKPRVLETFDNIASNYKKLRKLQDQNVEKALADEALTKAQVTRYEKLREEIITDVKSLSLNNVRIESLVEMTSTGGASASAHTK